MEIIYYKATCSGDVVLGSHEKYEWAQATEAPRWPRQGHRDSYSIFFFFFFGNREVKSGEFARKYELLNVENLRIENRN